MKNVILLIAVVVLSALIGLTTIHWTEQQHRKAIQQYYECKHHLQSISFLLEAFDARHQRLPASLEELSEENAPSILPRCPLSPDTEYVLTTAGRNFTILCQGQNHHSAGKATDTPWFTSKKGLIYD